jgi:hypothetical protein
MFAEVDSVVYSFSVRSQLLCFPTTKQRDHVVNLRGQCLLELFPGRVALRLQGFLDVRGDRGGKRREVAVVLVVEVVSPFLDPFPCSSVVVPTLFGRGPDLIVRLLRVP